MARKKIYIEAYSIQNEEKSVVAERFVRSLKNKTDKHMTYGNYIDQLDNVVNEYNSTYRTIKVKPVDVKDHTYIGSIETLMIKILNLKFVIMCVFVYVHLGCFR